MFSTTPPSVLIADDDADDRMLLANAFRDSRLPNPLHFVEDGEQLLEHLQCGSNTPPLPGLIVLDLNMPRLSGREALHALKADPRLRHIPVVVLSTSDCQEESQRCATAGACAYISKPNSYDALLDVVRRLGDYWIATGPLTTERQSS